MLVTEAKIIEIMQSLYTRRLLEAVNETDVVDPDGNVIITKDLKVRHKGSQYEYTVSDVVEDPETGKIMIQLRLPDEPRIDPPSTYDGGVLGDSPHDKLHVLDEDDLLMPTSDIDVTLSYLPTEDESEDDNIFVIDQEEFEKEYEVK